MPEIVGPISETIPLTRDADGTVRVGCTRVTLDVLMEAYDQGATPEQIVQKFGELKIDDVYAVITYYLRHQEDVRAYLVERERRADVLEKEIRSDPLNSRLQEKFISRKRDLHGSSK